MTSKIFRTRSYYVCRSYQPFLTHSNIQKLSSSMDEDVASINQWFTSNKLSFDAKRQNISVSINPVKRMASFLCYQSCDQ